MTLLRRRAAEAYGEVAALFARAEALRDDAVVHGWDSLAEGLQTCSAALDAAAAQLDEAIEAISETSDPLETAMSAVPGLTDVASILTTAHERLTDAALALHSCSEHLGEAQNWAELTGFEVLAGRIEQVREEIEELHQDTETRVEQVRADLGLAREESGPAPDEPQMSWPGQNPPGCTGLPGTDLLDPRRFAEPPDAEDSQDAEAMRIYARIIQMSDDVPRIAQVVGAPIEVIATVKRHFFLTRHVTPTGPEQTAYGYFSPDGAQAWRWESVATGRELDADGLELLRKFVAHEYVEARLMARGLPYRSAHPDCYANPTASNQATRQHYGAHDVAPNAHASDVLKHWRRWGGTRPSTGAVGDLSRIDEIVEAAMTLLRESGRDVR
ncbi:hypothetical protein [Kineosporia sp. NBRC 101731]|uniref:hypothetical protein n=1 Tax=Kineosporia sp. NBRC 101731 TaxID=3032199 RepID=UPI0024A38619|nr:hypothetical protein [Kineosporia sp. NBRC 101731]GLY30239.1 hypothetical protein Kisp02_36040 [Kineosporia sp. NBRC 101731]